MSSFTLEDTAEQVGGDIGDDTLGDTVEQIGGDIITVHYLVASCFRTHSFFSKFQ